MRLVPQTNRNHQKSTETCKRKVEEQIPRVREIWASLRIENGDNRPAFDALEKELGATHRRTAHLLRAATGEKVCGECGGIFCPTPKQIGHGSITRCPVCQRTDWNAYQRANDYRKKYYPRKFMTEKELHAWATKSPDGPQMSESEFAEGRLDTVVRTRWSRKSWRESHRAEGEK